jgi:hypothetical protein
MDEEAVLLWGVVALSSEPKVTLELAATELNPAVAMIAVAVSLPVSALPSPSALLACLLLFSTLAVSLLTTVASWLLSGSSSLLGMCNWSTECGACEDCAERLITRLVVKTSCGTGALRTAALSSIEAILSPMCCAGSSADQVSVPDP